MTNPAGAFAPTRLDCEESRLLAERGVWAVHDTIRSQIGELLEIREPWRTWAPGALAAAIEAHLGDVPAERYGAWFHYPWSGRLVHVLPDDEYRRVRFDRNRYKITDPEQARLGQCRIGVIGLSVGQAAAVTLAQEGVGRSFRLADFDTLSLSNLNRLRCGAADIGVNKAVLAARAITELDPWIAVEIFPLGATGDNLDALLEGLDLLVEECDDLYVKVLARERARALRIPVLMDTSDRGLVDVERFDREADRPLLHGLLGDVQAESVRGLPTKDKIPLVLRILGEDSLSVRMAATLPEVKETTSSWPQLASSVALGGAIAADVARRILLGTHTESGRYWVDFDAIVRDGAGTHVVPVVPAPSPSKPAYAEPPPPPRAGLDRSGVLALVASAILAPSGHNGQPWRFFWDGRALAVRMDRAQVLPFLDFGALATWGAIGGAIFNLELAARAAGLDPEVTVTDDASDPDRVCSVRFGPGAADCSPLLAEVPRRVTNRRITAPVPLGGAVERLREEARGAGATLHVIEDRAALDALAAIVGVADRLSLFHEPIHHEVMEGFRWTPEEAEATRDGLDVATLELSAADLAGLRLMRSWPIMSFLHRIGGGRGLEWTARRSVMASSAMALLTFPGIGPAAFFAGGRAMQAVWLAASALDVAVQPHANLPYLFARLAGAPETLPNGHRTELSRLRGIWQGIFPAVHADAEVLLVRLFRAPPPSARSLRRRVEDAVTFHP